jgi:hypothetical protein
MEAESEDQERPRIRGDFVAPNAKAKSLVVEPTVFSRLTDPGSQLWARYFAPGDTSVDTGGEFDGDGEGSRFPLRGLTHFAKT